MQKSVAIVLIIAAFLAGALVDRVLRWATTTESYASSYVPPPKEGANTDTSADPGTWDMKGCMASAQRRGMTEQESSHACQQILQ